MRLTLRTLLGWKDATLASEEYAFIGSRVVQSRLASGLVERIDSVLSAPPAALPGEGLGLYTDHLNGVAEYLDNVLASDELAGFERRCIESLQHLEEVAGVHAVLADAFHDGVVARSIPSARRRRIIAHLRALRRPASADGPIVNGGPPPTAAEAEPKAQETKPTSPVPATPAAAAEALSSQEAARRLLEEFAGTRVAPQPQVAPTLAPASTPVAARRWPAFKPPAILRTFNVAATVRPQGAMPAAPRPVKPQSSASHGTWLTLLAAAVALAAVLSFGGALASSLQGPRAYKPEPGCLHCTEP